MSLQNLPDPKRAYELLCMQGAYIPKGARQIVCPPGVEYRHPQRGRKPVTMDINLLSRSKLFVEEALREPMADHSLATEAVENVLPLIEEHYRRGLVWGFSGFATGGPSYAVEARAMRALMGSLKSMNLMPSLISDGGVDEGVLGVAGILARRFDVPSLGFLPRQGLASAGERTYMAVRMQTYQGREQLVGITPDVLVCVGGAGGTRSECEAALNQGSVVVLLVMRSYDPPSFVESHRDIQALADAEDGGQLFVCSELQHIMSVARRAATAAGRESRANRPERLATLSRLLAV
jgi:hypothetical protein